MRKREREVEALGWAAALNPRKHPEIPVQTADQWHVWSCVIEGLSVPTDDELKAWKANLKQARLRAIQKGGV